MCLSYTYNTFPFLVSKNPSFKIYKLKSWKVHCVVLTNYCRKYSDFVIIKMYKCHNCHQFDDELMMTHKLWHPPLYKLLLNWYWQYWSCVYLVSVWHQNCSIAHHYFADLPWQLNKHLLWCTRTNRKLTGGFFFLFSPLVFVWVWFWQDGLWKEVCDILLCLGGSKNKKERDSFFFWPSKWFHKKHIIAGPIFPCHPNSLEMLSSPWFFFLFELHCLDISKGTVTHTATQSDASTHRIL